MSEEFRRGENTVKKRRGAIVGAGYFAQFHADAWQRLPHAHIGAVAEPDLQRAQIFAEKWGIERVYPSLEALLDAEAIDFVDIATRPDSHLPLTRTAAERGVAVICQKPMAPSLSESREMVEVCAARGVRLLIHENWRWQPWYRQMRQAVEAGRLGTVHYVGARIRTGDGRGQEPYTVQPYFREMRRFLVFETLVHFLDTFRYLHGEIDSLYCCTQRLNPVIAGEDAAVIQVRFADGAAGVIDANRIAGRTPPEVAFGEVRVEGSLAAMRMTPDGDLWLTEYPGTETPYPFAKPAGGYKGDSIYAMQAHFLECLESGEAAESEGSAYLRTVELVEACYQSAASGQPERLS